MTSTQSALVGNGRLLVSLDGRAETLGASWPCVDSFNQLRALRICLPSVYGARHLEASSADQSFVSDTVVETRLGGVCVRDEVLDDVDVWVRSIHGESEDPLILVAPQLDGRAEDQTIYYDQDQQALLAYHRRTWVAIGGDASPDGGAVVGWQCSVGSGPASDETLDPDRPLTGERIASRVVHAYLRLAAAERVRIFVAFADSRERVLERLSRARARTVTGEAAGSTDTDLLLRQSRNVIRLLTSAETGGVLAGPPLQVDIASEPGYAAVWGRDAAWIQLGSLAAGDHDRVRDFLDYAFHVQSPEGLWLHRHHTDYSVGSSWGLHQLDETGMVLHLLACYLTETDDWAFAQSQWDGIGRAADFLASTIAADGLPIPSVDLWEERESRSAYTCASYVAGLRAGALIAAHLDPGSDRADRWGQIAERLCERVLATFWSDSEGRFLKAIQSRPALQLDDPDRTDLPMSWTQPGASGDSPGEPEAETTPLPQYPNWVTGQMLERDVAHDISVLSLAVPFGLIPAEDPRMVQTIERSRHHLQSHHVGGFARYEGDTYGGGNVWPVATMWVACWEAARGNTSATSDWLDWMRAHVGPNNLIAEQVHKVTGEPVAALPMAWSHGMVLLAQAALEGRHVWRPVSVVRN